MHRSAVFSDCLQYRYSLKRGWSEQPEVIFVMLNPSIADVQRDDPTIRRCIGLAQRNGFGGLEVVNWFAGRATRPQTLFAMDDPVGPGNSDYLQQAFQSDRTVVVAWGAFEQARQAYEGYRSKHGVPKLQCLGCTKIGAPRHPLYVRNDVRWLPWTGYYD
ncbi:MAG: DUF1643 domain-containing protein [Pseudomonadota bacterium]